MQKDTLIQFNISCKGQVMSYLVNLKLVQPRRISGGQLCRLLRARSASFFAAKLSCLERQMKLVAIQASTQLRQTWQKDKETFFKAN